MEAVKTFYNKQSRNTSREVLMYVINILRSVPGITINDETIRTMDQHTNAPPGVLTQGALTWPLGLDNRTFIKNIVTYKGIALDLAIDKWGNSVYLKFPALPNYRYYINGRYDYRGRIFNHEATIQWYANTTRTQAKTRSNYKIPELISVLERAFKRHNSSKANIEKRRAEAEVRAAKAMDNIAKGVQVNQYNGIAIE